MVWLVTIKAIVGKRYWLPRKVVASMMEGWDIESVASCAGSADRSPDRGLSLQRFCDF